MINFSNQGKHVLLSCRLTIAYTVNFLMERACEMDAVLLQKQLQSDLEKRIEKIRKESYEAGFKDAKAKRVKRSWFNGNIDSYYLGH